MKRLEYSPQARRKMKQIRTTIIEEYGEAVAEKVIRKMLNAFRSLEQFDARGISVAEMFGVDTEYRYLYTEHNYAFYRTEGETVKILDILHEREDFMQILFGIETLTDNSED